MRGEGPNRQGSGSADSGRGENFRRKWRNFDFGHGRKVVNSVFPAAKFVKFCGDIFMLVLRTLPHILPCLSQKISGLLQPSS